MTVINELNVYAYKRVIANIDKEITQTKDTINAMQLQYNQSGMRLTAMIAGDGSPSLREYKALLIDTFNLETKLALKQEHLNKLYEERKRVQSNMNNNINA